VTALADSAGALQASYRYDPYGRYLAGGGPLAGANVLCFSSKPWVGFAGAATSGLYYYGYRFYDPYLQRWVNRDPIEELGGYNLYWFVSNNPISRVDVLGLIDDSIFYFRPHECPPKPKKCILYHYEIMGYKNASDCAAAYMNELLGIDLGVSAGASIGEVIISCLRLLPSGILAATTTTGWFLQWTIFYNTCKECLLWESAK
jgi:RHS repeat-associated protein